MANAGFEQGFLSPTLRTGLIKLIPKGKNNSRVEDWRPITLLTTSYKIISGVVGNCAPLHNRQGSKRVFKV
jgi:hypothetical protein